MMITRNVNAWARTIYILLAQFISYCVTKTGKVLVSIDSYVKMIIVCCLTNIYIPPNTFAPVVERVLNRINNYLR